MRRKTCKECGYPAWSKGYCMRHYHMISSQTRNNGGARQDRRPVRKSRTKRAKVAQIAGKQLSGLPKSKVRQDLDKLFSLFIRMRDTDEKGVVKCISCRFTAHWKHLQNGHYIPRSLAPGLVFNEMNAHAQCRRCNMNEGNSVSYREALVQRYGTEGVTKLEALREEKSGLTLLDFEDMCRHYAKEVKQLFKRLKHEPSAVQMRAIKRWT